MLIRVRSNVGMKKLTLAEGARLDDLVKAVAEAFSLPAAGIRLYHDLGETRSLASGPLHLGGLEHGSLVYLAERMEKEVTSKASIDSNGNLLSAGIKFSAAASNADKQPHAEKPPSVITATVPVSALQRAAQKDLSANPLALQTPINNIAAPAPVVPARFSGTGYTPPSHPASASADPTVVDAAAAAREEERLLREYLNSVPDDDPQYRRADPVRRERLLGGSPPPSGFDSPVHVHPGFTFGPNRNEPVSRLQPPVTRVSSNSVGATVGTIDDVTLDADTLKAAREAGLSEYEIMRMVQGAADEALAKRLATGAASSSTASSNSNNGDGAPSKGSRAASSGVERTSASAALSRANDLTKASRFAGADASEDNKDTMDRLLAARLLGERAGRNFSSLEEGLALGVGGRGGAGRDRGLARTSSSGSASAGSSSPYERHLRRVRAGNLVPGQGTEGAFSLPSPPRPSAPPLDSSQASSRTSSGSSGGRSPKQLSLAELHRELGGGFEGGIPEAPGRAEKRNRLDLGVGAGTSADPYSFPRSSASSVGDDGDIEEQLMRIAINDSLLGTRPSSNDGRPIPSATSVTSSSAVIKERASKASDTRISRSSASGSFSGPGTSRLNAHASKAPPPRASPSAGPSLVPQSRVPVPNTAPNTASLNLVDLDEDEQLARAIRESMRSN